jgi:LAS superfamily LD-carboxypeptidase LdcB
MNFNQLTGRTKEHVVFDEDLKVFIDSDTATAFKELQLEGQKIGIDLQIVSSFRDYERQLKIWNEKAKGLRPILDDEGNVVQIENLSPDKILHKILRFSAMPGLSRHHWGTDLDIYDANKLSKENVQLINSECIAGGPFDFLHSWIDDLIANKKSLGFYRPYENEHAGVSPEKWHLSFAPKANLYWENYDHQIFTQNILDEKIELFNIIQDHKLELFNRYFKNIDHF